MFRSVRRSATKVRDGQVQRKNRWARSPNCFTHNTGTLEIVRQRPGEGFRHLVFQDDLRRFLPLLPEWESLQSGLRSIVLAEGGRNMGWHRPGVIAISAWERSLVLEDSSWIFIRDHQVIFDKLGVPYQLEDGSTIEFTEETARAFQLVHVLVHELGHHQDRMTTRSRKDSARGEQYAENYARKWEDLILDRYRREFDL